MLTAVYKTAKKAQMYLFVKQRDDFTDVPKELMAMFGTPTLVTIINLKGKDKLGFADIIKVSEALTEQGFYLQLPPPVEDLLAEHKARLKQSGEYESSEH